MYVMQAWIQLKIPLENALEMLVLAEMSSFVKLVCIGMLCEFICIGLRLKATALASVYQCYVQLEINI